MPTTDWFWVSQVMPVQLHGLCWLVRTQSPSFLFGSSSWSFLTRIKISASPWRDMANEKQNKNENNSAIRDLATRNRISQYEIWRDSGWVFERDREIWLESVCLMQGDGWQVWAKEGIRLQFQGFHMESAVILIEATCFFLLSFWDYVLKGTHHSKAGKIRQIG